MVFASYASVRSFNSERKKANRTQCWLQHPVTYSWEQAMLTARRSCTVCLRLLSSELQVWKSSERHRLRAIMASYFCLLKHVEFVLRWGKSWVQCWRIKGKACSALLFSSASSPGMHPTHPPWKKVFKSEMILILFSYHHLSFLLLCTFGDVDFNEGCFLAQKWAEVLKPCWIVWSMKTWGRGKNKKHNSKTSNCFIITVLGNKAF